MIFAQQALLQSIGLYKPYYQVDVSGMMQATPAQQAELQKIQGLQDKLAAELSGLSHKLADLQAETHKYDGIDGAKREVTDPLL